MALRFLRFFFDFRTRVNPSSDGSGPPQSVRTVMASLALERAGIKRIARGSWCGLQAESSGRRGGERTHHFPGIFPNRNFRHRI